MKSQTQQKNKVLLVDDEPNILIALEFLLTQAGYTVEKANDGFQALEKVASFKPQVAVLDVMMPGIDGFETATRMLKLEGIEDIRIVFLTARGTQSDRWAGYSAGGEVYLTKPFDNEDLVRTIDELVKYG
jgi:DNA-binding response OmpR family regulator